MLQLVICPCRCGSKCQFAPAPAEKSLIFVAVHNLYIISRIASCKAIQGNELISQSDKAYICFIWFVSFCVRCVVDVGDRVYHNP